jgi:tRNA pseudouridine32 synthase/23S rRNA pseudouridine746 synthase
MVSKTEINKKTIMDIKNGVGPSKVFVKNTEKTYSYLIDFLVEKFPQIPKEEWVKRMDQGLVLDEEGIPQDSQAPCQENTFIYYYRSIEIEESIPFQELIIYEDDHLLIADKPHFLPVTPAGHYLQETLLVRLKNKTGIRDLTPIHRIDRETAGLVAFSKRVQDRNLYQVLFRERQIKKTYEAIAPYQEHLKDQFPIERISRIEESDIFIQMQEVPGEPNSDTVIQLLEVSKPWAKYQLELGTGKKHQLRVHMNALGMPIKYDKIYPNIVPQPKMGKDFSEPLQLLAKQLSFNDPVTQLQHHFQSRFYLKLGAYTSENF